MTVATVAVVSGSKPEAIKALRQTWRRSADHFREQIVRFLRLSVAAAMPTLLPFLMGGHFDKKTLLAFLVPVLECAYRQIFPSLGAAAADNAPGMTIVPDQVGLPADPAPVPDEAPVAEDAPVEGDPDLDTAPTGDFSADGTPAPPDYVPEGDAAP
jgi:hypothetical protein